MQGGGSGVGWGLYCLNGKRGPSTPRVHFSWWVCKWPRGRTQLVASATSGHLSQQGAGPTAATTRCCCCWCCCQGDMKLARDGHGCTSSNIGDYLTDTCQGPGGCPPYLVACTWDSVQPTTARTNSTRLASRAPPSPAAAATAATADVGTGARSFPVLSWERSSCAPTRTREGAASVLQA